MLNKLLSRRFAVALAVPMLVLTGAGFGYGAADAVPITEPLDGVSSAAIPQLERLAPDVATLARFTALPAARPPAHASLGEEVLKFAARWRRAGPGGRRQPAVRRTAEPARRARTARPLCTGPGV